MDAGDVEFEIFVGESEGAVFVGGHYAKAVRVEVHEGVDWWWGCACVCVGVCGKEVEEGSG